MKFSKVLVLLLTVALVLTMGAVSFAEEKEVLSQPTDFKFDPYTGTFSFTATDSQTAYYFVRIFQVMDGSEADAYTVTSQRIKGKQVGELGGTVDLSSLGWGTYTAKLCSYPATGSNYSACEPVDISLAYGVGQVLEKPEMMVDYSGDRAEVVVDWISLSDYYTYQYMPFIKVTFYADSELTNTAYTQTFDTKDFVKGGIPFGGDAWGYDVKGGNFLHVLPDVDEVHNMGGYDLGTPIYDIYYMEDNFGFQLEEMGLKAGTYYVTCQAVSRDEYVISSKESEAIEIELTAEPFTTDYVCKTTTNWTTPWPWWSSPFCLTTVDYDREDYGKYNPVSGIAINN